MAATDFSAGPTASAGGVRPVETVKLPLVVWVYLFAVVIPIGVSLGPLVLTGLRVLLLVMILPLMFGLFTGKYGKIIATDVLFLLHIGWATVALAANNPGQVVEQVGSVGMEFLGGYALGRAYIRTREDFAALTKALIVVVLAMLPLALIETLTGRTLMVEALRKVPGIRTVAISVQEDRFGLDRVQLGFAHPIHFGLFCSVVFSLCFVAMEGTFGEARRWLIAFIVGAMGFLALSSGALLAIALQCGLIAWAMIFAKVEKRWWILFALFVLAYIAIDLLSNRKPIQVFMSYATFSAHTAYWRALIFEWGMKNVWANPILGLGLNDWIRPWFMHSGSMDNFWLVMAVRYGIPGFVFVTAGYILVVYHVMRRNFSGDETLTVYRRAWVFTFLGLSFTLCTVHVWTSIYSFVFFMLGAGVWLVTAQTQEASGVSDAKPIDAGRTGPVYARTLGDPTSATPRTAPRGLVAPQRPKQATADVRKSAPRYSRFDPSGDG